MVPPNTLHEGDVFKLDETYCDITVKKDDVLSIDEMKTDANHAHVCYEKFKLEAYIGDYNQQYGTAFSTKDSQQFENYFKDISKRLKEREKETFNDEKDRLDILLVVNMFLTGFDAKKVNTLYVDKNLKPVKNIFTTNTISKRSFSSLKVSFSRSFKRLLMSLK